MDRVEEQSAWSDVTGVNPPGQQNRVHLQHLHVCKQCTIMEKCLKAVCGGSGRCELELCVQLQGWDLPGSTEVWWEGCSEGSSGEAGWEDEEVGLPFLVRGKTLQQAFKHP